MAPYSSTPLSALAVGLSGSDDGDEPRIVRRAFEKPLEETIYRRLS
jgi:hypothetical protein